MHLSILCIIYKNLATNLWRTWAQYVFVYAIIVDLKFYKHRVKGFDLDEQYIVARLKLVFLEFSHWALIFSILIHLAYF